MGREGRHSTSDNGAGQLSQNRLGTCSAIIVARLCSIFDWNPFAYTGMSFACGHSCAFLRSVFTETTPLLLLLTAGVHSLSRERCTQKHPRGWRCGVSQFTIPYKQRKWHNLDHDDAGAVIKIASIPTKRVGIFPEQPHSSARLFRCGRGSQQHPTHLLLLLGVGRERERNRSEADRERRREGEKGRRGVNVWGWCTRKMCTKKLRR